MNELILLFLHLEVPHTHPPDDSSCPKASVRTQYITRGRFMHKHTLAICLSVVDEEFCYCYPHHILHLCCDITEGCVYRCNRHTSPHVAHMWIYYFMQLYFINQITNLGIRYWKSHTGQMRMMECPMSLYLSSTECKCSEPDVSLGIKTATPNADVKQEYRSQFGIFTY